MAKSIVCLYDHMQDAQAAVQDLVDGGFPRENISVVANDARNQSMTNAEGLVDDAAPDRASEANNTAAGAGAGAVLGGVAGLLVGLGGLIIPGIGPIVAAGPLLGALAGAGVGAVAGGVVAALTDVGVPDEDAYFYAEGVRRGGTLVLVYAGDEQAEWVVDKLNNHNPVDIKQRSTEWQSQSWTGFNENNEQYAFDSGPKESYHKREPRSPLDYGPGARSYLSGQPVNRYDQGSASLGNYQNVTSETWLMYESRFREHFRENYAKQPEARWEDYRDSYRFGFDMGHLPAYSNQTWDQVASPLQQRWEEAFPSLTWEHYRQAVHDGFEAGHVPQ